MHRRDLLRASGLAGVLAAFRVPGLAHSAALGRAGLARAVRRAERNGKPLLCFVVPAEASVRRRRAVELAGLFEHGSDAHLADLALGEPACVTRRDLGRAFPELLFVGEPHAFLAERAEAGSRLAAEARAELSPRPVPHDGGDLPVLRAWVTPLARALGRLLLPAPESLVRRERDARTALDRRTIRHIDRWLGEPEGEPRTARDRATLLEGAALVRAAVRAEADSAARWLPLLARPLRDELTVEGPPGARWRTVEIGAGCGGLPCGAAFAPAEGLRFLSFYTEES